MVNVVQKFMDVESVQRASAMAISSLARLKENREKLGESRACEFVHQSLQKHMQNEDVVGKLAVSIEYLSRDSSNNISKFTDLNSAKLLLSVFQRHEKNASVVADTLRALILLSSVKTNQSRAQSEEAFKMYIRAMKVHEKSPSVGQWGCNMIYVAATEGDMRTKAMLGNVKACETVIRFEHLT